MTREVQVGDQEKFLSWKNSKALEEAAWDGDGATIPESVQKPSGCGVLWYGLVGMEAGLDDLGGLFQA